MFNLVKVVVISDKLSALFFSRTKHNRIEFPCVRGTTNLNCGFLFHLRAMTNSTDILIPGNSFFLEELKALKSFMYHVWLCILISGLASNSINIIVFVKVGLTDNVTLTLLFLSLSDLLNLMLKCPMNVATFILTNYPNYAWPFDPQILYVGIYWYAYVFYDYSSFISVFLALVRCACVAKPLRFKSMFTIPRTFTILGVLFFLALTLRIPVLTIIRLTWAVNPLTNLNYRSIWVVDNFEKIYKANDIVNRNIVSWIAYITVTTCVLILASKLQAASRFRQSSQSTTQNASTENSNSTLGVDKSKTGTNPFARNMKASNTLSTKDLQVIKSVTLVCVIFIVSQLPIQIKSTIRLFDPEFSNRRKKKFASGFASLIVETFGLLNTVVNIFVYYHFNSRYRETLLHCFSKGSAVA